jgi:hypothetical protein
VYVATTCAASHAADMFVPPGAKATISVEYVYESAGKKRIDADTHEWRVKRTASLTAELGAQLPTAMPTVQAIDASQMGALTGKADKAQAVTTKMAPMMADAQKIMAKCGEDEACITREAMKMGAAMQGTPQMATAMSARKDMQELSKQDAARYQAWRPTAERGTYLIEETVHNSLFDMACPRQHCTRDETRKGSGEIKLPPEVKVRKGEAASIAAVEVDSGKNTLTLVLPAPLLPLPITETITTDEIKPETPTPKGPQPKLQSFRVNASGGYKPFTVPLKGGWRSQSGEQVMDLKGNFGDEGKLTVRWRFVVL